MDTAAAVLIAGRATRDSMVSGRVPRLAVKPSIDTEEKLPRHLSIGL